MLEGPTSLAASSVSLNPDTSPLRLYTLSRTRTVHGLLWVKVDPGRSRALKNDRAGKQGLLLRLVCGLWSLGLRVRLYGFGLYRL